MSLKSKLEAVIYAADEPVTLGQLATLFGAEALEWKAAQEADAAQKVAANADATAVDPSQPMIAEGLEYLELRTEDGTLLEQPGFAVLPAAEPERSGQQAQAGQTDGQIGENAEDPPTGESARAKTPPQPTPLPSILKPRPCGPPASAIAR